jgi:hypothetical protein
VYWVGCELLFDALIIRQFVGGHDPCIVLASAEGAYPQHCSHRDSGDQQRIPSQSIPRAPLFSNALFSTEENAQCAQSTDLPCGNMKRNTGPRPKCFPDPEPLRREYSGTQSLCAERHVCPAQAFDFRFSTVNS